MPYLNKVTLMGHLTRDPEMRYTPTGIAVTSFSIATNWGSGDNKTTEFHNCTIFNGKVIPWAEQTAGLAKGDLVYTEGRLQTREWQDKEGNTRKSTDIICHLAHFLRKPSGESRVTSDPEEEIPF